MFDFLRREQPGFAAVYFPGTAPPPADAFLRLRDRGYRLEERRLEGSLWGLHLDHPTLGQADLACERETPLIDDLIRFSHNLTDAERAAASGSRSAVLLRVPATRRHVLRDRKMLLRIARDVLGEDGVMVLDLGPELPWSRASLDDELAHDADLDVEALYCLQAVSEDAAGPDGSSEAQPVGWLHTHGLGELGRFDLEFVAPHPAFVAECGDLMRALATMVLDGSVSSDEGRFTFGEPGGVGRLVPASEFMRDAEPALAALRDADDHDDRRSVVCEPVGRRLLGFGRGDRPEPLRFARRPPPERFVIHFPTSAMELMAERAKLTVGVLRSLMAEFASLEVVALVKLGYPRSDGDGSEHLWFHAHGIGASAIDATLENRPFAVDLRQGERAERPLELLTDWMLLTPEGPVTPRSMSAARRLRASAT